MRSAYREWNLVNLGTANRADIAMANTAGAPDMAGTAEPTETEELAAHLVRMSRLTPQEARSLIDEVMNFLDELPEDFIRRRHRVLQAEGRSNAEIFAQISTELGQRRFRAPRYTERQLRRIIYG